MVYLANAIIPFLTKEMEKSKNIIQNLENFNKEEEGEETQPRKQSFKATDSDSEEEFIPLDKKSRKEKGKLTL